MIHFQVDPMSALMGGGGPPPGPGPSGPPQDPGAGDQSDASGEDKLKQALQLMREALVSGDLEPDEESVIEQATTAVQKVFATQAKNQDAAMGTTPAHKHVQKATKRVQKQGGGGY